MKIFHLYPNPALSKNESPWSGSQYDKVESIVIRAKDENEARKIADKNAGDENSNFPILNARPWLDGKYTICYQLRSKGKSGVICKDYNAG